MTIGRLIGKEEGRPLVRVWHFIGPAPHFHDGESVPFSVVDK